MDINDFLDTIIADDLLHAKWVNTLSMMENTGARKISTSEHKTSVSLMILKHAAEEARHAFYLKKQISRLGENLCPDYSPEWLVCPVPSHAYLHRLDVEICRYLKNELKLNGNTLKYGAYLLVTYAIEVRADALYPAYQAALSRHQSKISVKSIILEEETHLAEMLAQMERFFEDFETVAAVALALEQKLHEDWVKNINNFINTREAIPAFI